MLLGHNHDEELAFSPELQQRHDFTSRAASGNPCGRLHQRRRGSVSTGRPQIRPQPVDHPLVDLHPVQTPETYPRPRHRKAAATGRMHQVPAQDSPTAPPELDQAGLQKAIRIIFPVSGFQAAAATTAAAAAATAPATAATTAATATASARSHFQANRSG